MLDKPGFAATTLAQRDIFRPKRPGGMSRGALLAIGAHGLLILALALGLRWRTSTPEVVSAELWSATPQQAAPPPPTPVEPPPPPPPPPPEPVVRAPPPPPAVQPDTREADIALERQREAQRRVEEEKRERERRELQARKEKERQEVEKREQEKKELQARKDAEEKKKREAAEEKRREQEEQLRVVRQRDDQLKRMHQQIGTGSTETATAAREASISAEYGGRIRARIKPNIVFAEDIAGNPTAVVIVGVAPSGKIISRRLQKSSGNKAWDDAVLRAIDRTDVLPRDVDGSVPSSMQLDFKPNE